MTCSDALVNRSAPIQAKTNNIQELELRIREEKERFENSFSSLKQLKAENEATVQKLNQTKESLLQKQNELSESSG